MPFTLLRSLLNLGGTLVRPARLSGKGRSRPRVRGVAAIGIESLEERTALAVGTPVVPPPSIGLAAASDTGAKGDGFTRIARPTFTGLAPARSNVVVYNDGQLVGIATAGVRGTWSLPTPAASTLTDGGHIITAYSVSRTQVWSAPTAIWISIDATPPTASLDYDVGYRASPSGNVTGRVTLTFSEPVQGVRLANLWFTDPAARFSASLGDSRLRSYVGAITMTQLSDRSYAFTPSVQSFAPGTYVLSFLKTGVTDLAGNPLPAAVSTSLTISQPA